MQAKAETTEVMVDFRGTTEGNLTDIWMACNAFTYRGPTGVLEGADPSIGAEESVATLLGVSVKQALVGQKFTILREAFLPGKDIRLPERVLTEAAIASERDESARRECLTTAP